MKNLIKATVVVLMALGVIALAVVPSLLRRIMWRVNGTPEQKAFLDLIAKAESAVLAGDKTKRVTVKVEDVSA